MQRDYIRNEHAPSKITTREILSCEWEIVCLARDGRGKFAEFNPLHKISAGLMPDQRAAAEMILGRVILSRCSVAARERGKATRCGKSATA
jgi:hypothetical protein